MCSTKEQHSRSGKYTLRRVAVHKRIIRSLITGFTSQEEPEIIFMCGGTASGKSTIRDIHLEMHDKKENVIIIDCDNIKTMIPEYEGLKRSNKATAADLVHQESADIAEALLEEALKRKLHIVLTER